MPNSIANQKVSIKPQEKKVAGGRDFPTVVITESKGSKWGYYDDLASQSNLRKISTFAFRRAWFGTGEPAAETEII